MAAADAGFFYFDTNANAIADNIVAAMTKIETALASAQGRTFDQTRNAANIGAMGPVFDKLQQDITSTQGKLAALMDPSRWSGGVIDPTEFSRRAAALLRGDLRSIPDTLAREMAAVDSVVAKRVDMSQTARLAGKSFIDSMSGFVATNGTPELQAAFDRVAQNLRKSGELAYLTQNPVNYDSGTQGTKAALINRLRAEEMLQGYLDGRVTSQDLQRSGFGEIVTRMKADPSAYGISLGEVRGKRGEDPRTVVISETQKELAQLLNAERQAAPAAYTTAKAREAEAKATRELAAAEEMLNNAGWRKMGGLWLGPAGQVRKETAAGATADNINPLRTDRAVSAAAQYDQEVKNLQHLMRNWDRVQQVGAYEFLDGRFFKTAGDHGYRQIQNQGEINRLLERRNELRDKEISRALRLNELDGKRLMRGEANNSGLLGGFVGRFHRGDQSVLTSMGGQIASAAAFTLAYGSIFALTGALADVLVQFNDYQDSLTDLEVATRSADLVTTDWVNSLGELSRLSGANVGAALDAAARGVRAFTDPLKDSEERIHAVGTAMADTSTRLALIANKDMRDATGDIVSVASAFGLDPEQLDQIVEAVAQAKRTLGGDPAQISQGLAFMAGTAKEAGFNLQEAANVISLVQARTDQSGQAIATRLSRVFQIMSGSTGKNLASELGQDFLRRTGRDLGDASIRDQFIEYARIFSNPSTSESVRDRITSALGGTANLREVLPLLKEGSRLSKAYRDALRNAGVGTDEFNRKTNNLVGTLKKLGGDLKNIKTDTARANLFAPVGGAIMVLEPALHAVDLLIKAYDKLAEKTGEVFGDKKNERVAKEWVQTILALGANVAIAAAGIKMVQRHSLQKVASGSVGLADDALFGIAASTGASVDEVAEIQKATRARMAVEAQLNSAVASATRARVAAEAGGAAGSWRTPGWRAGTFLGGLATLGRFLTNPWTLGIGAGIGGFALAGKAAESRDAERKMLAEANTTAESWRRIDGSSESLRQAAYDIRIAAGNVKNSDLGWFGNEEKRKQLTEDLTRQARQMQLIARRVDLERAEASALDQLSAFGDGAIETVADLADGLAAVAAAGGTAMTQLDALIRVLTTVPTLSEEPYLPQALATEIQKALMGGIVRAIPKEGTKGVEEPLPADYTPPENNMPPYDVWWDPAANGGKGGPDPINRDIDRKEARQRFQADNDPLDVQRAAISLFEGMGWDKKLTITNEDKQKAAEALAKSLDVTALGEDWREIVKKGVDFAAKRIEKENLGGIVAPNLLNDRNLSVEDMNRLLLGSKEGDKEYVGLLAAMDSADSFLPSSDLGGAKEQRLKANINALKAMRDKLPAGKKRQHATLEWAIAEKEHELVMTQLERINDIREAAESRAKTDRELQRIRIRWAKRAAGKAFGDAVALEGLFEMLDQQSINAVLAYLKAQGTTIRLAIQHTKALLENARAMLAAGAPYAVNSVTELEGQLAGQRGDYREWKRNYGEAEDIAKNRTTVEEKKATLDGGGGAAKDEHTAWQHSAMAAQAAIDPDDTVGAAAAAVELARANLAAAKTFDERTAAQQELNSAQDAYDKAVATHASAVAQVNAARTKSPIDAAKAELDAASAAMRAAAEGTDAYLQALAQWYQAQWAMRDAVLAYKANMDQLKGDMTDPVEQARDAARDARRRLRSDQRNGAGPDVIAGDKVAAENAENAVEAARMQQRLSDWETAEQLGKISHAKHISLLEAESRRMHAMRNKTRQQIDYMNQVDLDLKNAKQQMDAMWNFGDINTKGLAYQMRRYRESMQAEQKAAAPHNWVKDMVDKGQQVLQQHVNINVNGADVGWIKKLIAQYLGSPSYTRTNQTRRR